MRVARCAAYVGSIALASCGGRDIVQSTSSDPCARKEYAVPAPRIHTPRWAFEPWISKDISNRDDTYAFVDGFRSRGISVGAVVLDSPWETSYN